MDVMSHHALPAFLVALSLLSVLWSAQAASLAASAPFPVRRLPRAPTLPIHRDGRLKDPPVIVSPAFKPSTNYSYNIGLNSSADVFQFATSIGDPPSEGFGATVAAALLVITEPLDQSPEPDTVVFRVGISVSKCNVQKGPSKLDKSSGEFVRDPRATNDSCGLDSGDISQQPLVYVTQNLTSGEFINVYWNQSTSGQDPNNLQDPAAYTKLLVSTVRTLQSTYSPGSRSYVVERPGRFGTPRNITYTYIGTVAGTGDPCFDVEAESVQGDQFEEFHQQVCYSNSSTGGISMASSGDSADLGTPEAPGVIPVTSCIIADWTTITSQDDTASMYLQTKELPDPGLGVVTDARAGYIFGTTPVVNVFTLNDKGVLARWSLKGNTVWPNPIGNTQPSPLVFISGVSLQQMVPGPRDVFAVDVQGVIWVYRTDGNDVASAWVNYTDPGVIDPGSQVLDFHPWTKPCAATSPPSEVFGFWVSTGGQAFILSSAVCAGTASPRGPIVSAQIPSLDVVMNAQNILELQPVGVSWVLPHVAAVTASQKLVFSFYSPTPSINIADGYSDWNNIDLGTDSRGAAVNVTHVETFHFPAGFKFPNGQTLAKEEDGILVVLANSSVCAILATSAATNALSTPQLVLDSNGLPVIGVDKVSFDPSIAGGALPTRHAIATPFGGHKIRSLQYVASGQWRAFDSWQPFQAETQAKVQRDQPLGYPAMNAQSAALSTLQSSSRRAPAETKQVNFQNLTRTGFDDPFWYAASGDTCTTDTMTAAVKELFVNPTDTNALLEFRRFFAACSALSIGSLWQAITSGQIVISDDAHASPIFGAVYEYPVSSIIADNMAKIMNGQQPNANAVPVRASAITQSPSLPCFPAVIEDALITLAFDPTLDKEISLSAQNALAAFVGKGACPFDTPDYDPAHHETMNRLLDTTSKHQEIAPHELLGTVYGMANTRHPDVVDAASDLLHHNSSSVRVGAIRAIANVPTLGATTKLVHNVLHHKDKAVRRYGMAALAHHQTTDWMMVTQQLLRYLYQPRVRRHQSDLDGFATYFRKRAGANAADSRLARAGAARLRIIQHAVSRVNDTEAVAQANFSPLVWDKEFGGYNAKFLVGLHVESDLDATGATFYAGADLGGEIFETDFDIASAGIEAVATSGGLISLTAWLAVFLLDLPSFQQVPYYVIAIQYQAATAVQVSSGDACNLTQPSPLAKSIRETRTFISATYYYGIPMIADVNLRVELVGWYGISYGIGLKTDQPISHPYPGQIAAYLDPNAGISGQISANVHLLVVSGGIKGSLDFATIDLKVSGGAVVNSPSPLTVGFGDSIILAGQFLLGSVDLNVEIWECCCWTCWWSCCWRCGGSCNSVWTKSLFTWNGYSVSVPIDDRSNLCSTLADSSKLPATPYDGRTALEAIMDAELPPAQDNLLDVDPDSELYCDCDDAPYWLRDRYVDYTPFFESTQGVWSKGAMAPLYTSAVYNAPNLAQPFTYDCSATGYPEVCINTMCYFLYSLGTHYFSLTYSDTRENRRKLSLSLLPTVSGKDRDEVPMNKCVEGGCCARIQALDPTQNRRHGAVFCAYLNHEFGPKNYRPNMGVFEINIPSSVPRPNIQECRKSDLRYLVTDLYFWQPPSVANCPNQCGSNWPGYIVFGRPLKQGLQLLIFHDGDVAHPNLRYDAEDVTRVQVDPQAHPDYVILHSRLENLTVAGTALVRNSQAVGKLGEKHVEYRLATGPTASIRLRLAREMLQKEPQDGNNISRVDMPIDTAWSHLVAHKNAPRTVWEAFSEARGVPSIRLGRGRAPADTTTEATRPPLRATELPERARLDYYAEVLGRVAQLGDAVLEKPHSAREIVLLAVLAAMSVWYLARRFTRPKGSNSSATGEPWHEPFTVKSAAASKATQ